VAGELLRLIAGHPQLDVAAILSDSQPGAPVAGALRICAAPIRSLKKNSPIRRDRGTDSAHAAAAPCSPRRPTVLPPPSSIGCWTGRGGGLASCTAVDIRPTSAIRVPPPTSRVQACTTARRREFGNSPAPSRNTCRNRRRRTSRIPMLRHRDAARLPCPCWALGSPHASVRDRHHGQHRFGRKPIRRALIIRIGTAISTPTAPEPSHVPEIIACAKLATGSKPNSTSCRIPDPSRRHTCHRAGPASRTSGHGAGAGSAPNHYRIAPSCAWATARLGSGCGDQHYAEFERVTNGNPLRHVGGRHLNKGPPAAHSMDESLIGNCETTGLTAPVARLT